MLTYLLQGFSLLRAEVSDSSAHVCGPNTDRKRNSTVTVNRGRRVCVSVASPWCSLASRLQAAGLLAVSRLQVEEGWKRKCKHDTQREAGWLSEIWGSDRRVNSAQEGGTREEKPRPSTLALKVQYATFLRACKQTNMAFRPRRTWCWCWCWC